LATILSTKFVQAAPIGLAERVAATALSQCALAAGSGAAAADCDAGGAHGSAPSFSPSISIAQTVERQISMLRMRWFAAYALSAAIFLGACSVVVHRLIFHDRGTDSQTSVRTHRD
jgi:hypothetical protein